MSPFAYSRAADIDSAIQNGAEQSTKYLGGGTNLLDLMKGGIERPLRRNATSRSATRPHRSLGVGGLDDGGECRSCREGCL